MLERPACLSRPRSGLAGDDPPALLLQKHLALPHGRRQKYVPVCGKALSCCCGLPLLAAIPSQAGRRSIGRARVSAQYPGKCSNAAEAGARHRSDCAHCHHSSHEMPPPIGSLPPIEPTQASSYDKPGSSDRRYSCSNRPPASSRADKCGLRRRAARNFPDGPSAAGVRCRLCRQLHVPGLHGLFVAQVTGSFVVDRVASLSPTMTAF